MTSYTLLSGILLAFCAILLPSDTNSARILSLVFFSSKSQIITYQPLLEELATRGHAVTYLGPVVFGSKKVHEILTFDAMKLLEDDGLNMFEDREKSKPMDPRSFLLSKMLKVCNITYDLPHVKALLKETFDLVIVPSYFNECAFGYAYKFNAPIIVVSPALLWTSTSQIFGTPSPPSFCVNAMLPFSDEMTFYERGYNFIYEAFLSTMIKFSLNPQMEALYREKLNDPTLPSSNEILSEKGALILANSHLSLGQPRPFLPDIIEVGGMHCRPPKPLPKDLEAFVNSTGKDGFILFSMGTALKGSQMPDKRRKAFLGAFAKLKQKVLWKWETETMEDLPPNVKLSKWLPQQDVLGHPKIKAFITHGGFGSITETVYHGVPLIGIPMFGDQNLNIAKAVTSGYALSLEYTDLTEELLLNAIKKIIDEPSFRERAQTLSKVFQDQPDKPLNRAVFWTEYVLRHKGAPHLRSPARDLNIIQYHSLDVIGVFLAGVVVVLYVTKKVIGFILRKIGGLLFGSSKPKASSQKKRN